MNEARPATSRDAPATSHGAMAHRSRIQADSLVHSRVQIDVLEV